MKLIDLLDLISKDEIKPITYFKINCGGRNFIIKYLYYAFIIEKVSTSCIYDDLFKKGDYFDSLILANLNKNIEILGGNQ